jgi:tripartite-type tricarboxylate transporter receptor subunit TctC
MAHPRPANWNGASRPSLEKQVGTALAVCFVVLLAVAADAQAAQRAGADSSYPTKPVRLIVPQAPGGSNDIMARSVGQYLGGRLGRQVVVDNRPGADALIGTDMAARSAPDGYTLLLVSSAYTMNPAVRKLPYDPLKAFDWVAMLGSGPTALTVGPLLPVNSVKELLAVAKAKPGHITMASAGGFQHFVHVLFSSLSGHDLTVVLYKGGAPAMIDVMGGQAHLTIGTIIQSLPHIRSGRLKALATGGAKRAAALPDLPTIAEAGVPGYVAVNWWALAVPAGTPPAIIARLSAEVGTFLSLPETRKRFTDEGAEVDFKSPEELRMMIPIDIAKWTKVAKAAGMRAE